MSCLHHLFLFSVLNIELKGQAVDDQLSSTSPPDLLNAGHGVSHLLPTIPANTSQQDSTAAPQPVRIPPSKTRKAFKQ